MKNLIFLILAIALIAPVLADSATYKILDGKKVDVIIQLDSRGEITLPKDYSNLESTANYNLKEQTLITNEATTIQFSTKSLLDKSSSEQLFILEKFSDSKIDIKIFLPLGYTLSENLAFPKGYATSTDGKNIIIEWKDFEDTEILLFYKDTRTKNTLYDSVAYILIASLAILLFSQKSKHKKKLKKMNEETKNKTKKLKQKTKTTITKNLFGDEKKIMEYLLYKKGNSSWTKEMVKDLDIPKVRLSRKLRSLSEKGLIKKESHGNENRITLIKK